MEREDVTIGRPSGGTRPGGATGPTSSHSAAQHREWVRQVLKCPDIEEARRLVRNRYPDETSEQIDQRIETARTSGERKVPKPFQPVGVPPEIKAARKALREAEKKKRRHARQIDAVEKQLAAARRRLLRELGKGR
ncbi:hypothetical protein N0B44_33955 [Roseibacterium beibuensis]|uniref:hypothetical protein n=1 Tax=[Roseibacterium] beibuensis TaxID=1193142 RepID=UPI00217D7BF6|nr:hypothetical protein [Roseibacterium beibuensis]MCS6627918.1 hypothetical protein [Roseibacterium beibuensis]